MIKELGTKNIENGYLLGVIKIFKIGHLLGKSIANERNSN